MQPTSKLDWAIYTFIARGCRKTAEQNPDAGEKIELKLVDFDEFMQAATEDDSFMETETTIELLRAKNDPRKMAEIKKLFGLE